MTLDERQRGILVMMETQKYCVSTIMIFINTGPYRGSPNGAFFLSPKILGNIQNYGSSFQVGPFNSYSKKG
jgi:hypothetical protein